MLERICNEKDICLLDLVIDKESEYLDILEEKKEKLDFGPKIKPQELPGLLSEVKTEVDKFLGITETRSCNIGYASLSNWEIQKDMSLTSLIALPAFSLVSSSVIQIINPSISRGNLIIMAGTATLGLTLSMLRFEYNLIKHNSPCYEPSKKRIFLKECPRATLIPTIAHEYMHHVESSIIDEEDHKKFGALSEGLATGVERHIAQLYRDRENNEAFLYSTMINTEFGMIESNDYLIKKYRSKLPKKAKLDNHHLGPAYFMLEEAKKGKGIYAEIMQKIKYSPNS